MTRNQFVDALKLFLDTADPGELENLALRLKPYRITSLQVQRPDGGPSARSIPVIVLDDGRKTPEPTPSLQQHLDSLTAASQSVSIPKISQPILSTPTLPPSLDSFFDFNSLPWPSTDLSCPATPGNVELSIEDMILDDDQLGDLSAEFSMPGTPGYASYHPMQDTRIPITPPYSDFFNSSNAPSTFSSDPYSPSTFLDTPITSPSPSSDAGDCQVNTPNALTYASNNPETTPVAQAPPTPTNTTNSTGGTSPNPRTQAKINRRRNNPIRARRNPTAASITQAILSSGSGNSSNPLTCSQPSSDPSTAALVFSSCIRKDYLDFLRTNLPEWVRDGLWRSSSPLRNNSTKTASGNNNNNNNNRPCFMMMPGSNNHSGTDTPHQNHRSSHGGAAPHFSSDAAGGQITSSSSSTYGFLENIYSCVSQLDSRIETDQVRKRVALVLLHSEYLESYQDWKATRQGLSNSSSSPGNKESAATTPAINVKGGVGRGDMTLMIDNILEQTTPGWEGLSPKRKLQLRALFHERKRYGKRWAVFREEVGCAILLVCSGQLGNMVSNTKVTMAALKGIAHAIRDSAPIMEVLKVLEPLAEALVNNDGYRAFGNMSTEGGGQGHGGVAQMIRRFEQLQAKRGSLDSAHGGSGGDSYSEDEDMD